MEIFEHSKSSHKNMKQWKIKILCVTKTLLLQYNMLKYIMYGN